MKKIFYIVEIVLGFLHPLSAQEVSLTVYNQNRALVREIRTLSIPSGKSNVTFADVAAQIDPTSVHFKSLTSPDKLAILEQNYEYDLISASKLMQKYVDRQIRLVMEKGEVFEGKLLSSSGSDIVLQGRDNAIKVVQSSGVQHFDFPNLPEGLITRPTLVWMVENTGPENHNTEVSYLTAGVNWHAEYVAVVDAEEKSMDLGGWVSLENHSGATYQNAKLKLVAGDVHQVQPRGYRGMEMEESRMLAKAAPQFEEKPFFEYHLYALQRKTTVKDNQIKQVSLFPLSKTKIRKIFIYDGATSEKKVQVHLEFENKKTEGLGLPLPAGKIRVLKEDADGALEFVGEDLIGHTPVDEKVRVFLGNAFDLVGERTKKTSKQISTRSLEETYEIVLRNHKKESVEIVAVEHFWGDWEISKSSHDFIKKDANTAEFPVKILAQNEVVLTYTVTVRW